LLGENAICDYAGYNASVDPSISNIFSTASYRYGHSSLSSELLRLDNYGSTADEGNLALLDAFFAPGEIVDNGIDSLLLGATVQVANEIDTQIVDDVRNFLFGSPGEGGFDLASLNIQRGRDHGLADYNQAREDFGLERVADFSQITSDPELAAKLEDLYGDVDNIDAWVGGLAEDHVAGSSMGELNRTVIVDQFEQLRNGDRLWYENVFSGRELHEIDNTTLADVIERNTDVSDLQENVFFAPDAQPETGGWHMVDDHHGMPSPRREQMNVVERPNGPMQTPQIPDLGPVISQAGDQQRPDLTSREQSDVPTGLVGLPFEVLENNGRPRDIAPGETAQAAATTARAGAVATNPNANDQLQRTSRLRESLARRGERPNPTDAVDEVFTELGEIEAPGPLNQQPFARRSQGRRRR
jgi:hypothetical protein